MSLFKRFKSAFGMGNGSTQSSPSVGRRTGDATYVIVVYGAEKHKIPIGMDDTFMKFQQLVQKLEDTSGKLVQECGIKSGSKIMVLGDSPQLEVNKKLLKLEDAVKNELGPNLVQLREDVHKFCQGYLKDVERITSVSGNHSQSSAGKARRRDSLDRIHQVTGKKLEKRCLELQEKFMRSLESADALILDDTVTDEHERAKFRAKRKEVVRDATLNLEAVDNLVSKIKEC
eukprot:Nk52_evm9s62 gene=Nk52_evmTU9s62